MAKTIVNVVLISLLMACSPNNKNYKTANYSKKKETNPEVEIAGVSTLIQKNKENPDNQDISLNILTIQNGENKTIPLEIKNLSEENLKNSHSTGLNGIVVELSCENDCSQIDMTLTYLSKAKIEELLGVIVISKAQGVERSYQDKNGAYIDAITMEKNHPEAFKKLKLILENSNMTQVSTMLEGHGAVIHRYTLTSISKDTPTIELLDQFDFGVGIEGVQKTIMEFDPDQPQKVELNLINKDQLSLFDVNDTTFIASELDDGKIMIRMSIESGKFIATQIYN